MKRLARICTSDGPDYYARQWLQLLAEEELAPVEYHEPRGNTFLDMTIEGQRFHGTVFGNSLMIGPKYTGVCSLGVTAINFVPPNAGGVPTWALCKYGNQWHMSLSLSERGLRRLAVEFGIPIVPLLEPEMGQMVDDPSFFYNSRAFAAIRRWARAHPRKIMTLRGDAYLYLWPLSAVTGRPMDVNEENIALGKNKAALKRFLAGDEATTMRRGIRDIDAAAPQEICP